MIKIIGKGYKKVLLQLNDFSGNSEVVTISLKSVSGISKYEKLFGKKRETEKGNIKIRIIHLTQSMLTDFFDLFKRTISKATILNLVSNNNKKFKVIFSTNCAQIPKQRKKSIRNVIPIFQTLLEDFLGVNDNILKNNIRLPYKIIPKTPKYIGHIKELIPHDEMVAFKNYEKFKGYLGHLFVLNQSIDTYFNDLQDSISYKPQSEALSLRNIMKLEISRCKLGYLNFESFLREYNQNSNLRKELGIESGEKISLTSYRRNLLTISRHMDKFAEIILQECRDLKLIDDKIWIWDRRFFKCNCNGLKDKKTGTFSDPDAGHYVKKTGKYSILSGTGYTDTCIVDRLFGLPVYWDAVDASKNDNKIFQETVNKYTESTAQRPIMLIADAGPDSHISNLTVLDKQIIPVIAARSNSVGTVLKTGRGNHFRASYIPRIYHRLLQNIYDLRTCVERKNSNDVVGYNRLKTLTRGLKWAKLFVSISNITALLTAMAAFKVERFDLIRAPGAFRRLRI